MAADYKYRNVEAANYIVSNAPQPSDPQPTVPMGRHHYELGPDFLDILHQRWPHRAIDGDRGDPQTRTLVQSQPQCGEVLTLPFPHS
jgi:hypothetical protein